MVEFLILVGLVGGSYPSARWVHPLAQPLEIDRNIPFVELTDEYFAPTH